MEPEKPKFNKGDFLRRREYAILSAVQYLEALCDDLEHAPDDRNIKRITKKAKACLLKAEELRSEISIKAIELEGAS
jgi:radical SAM superfamily enzyme